MLDIASFYHKSRQKCCIVTLNKRKKQIVITTFKYILAESEAFI